MHNQTLKKISGYFGKQESESDLLFLNVFNYAEIEKIISDINGNITQLNSHNICLSKDEKGYLLSYPQLEDWGGVDYRSNGMNIKFAENKEQLIQYIQDDKELNTTLSCLYSSVNDVKKMKSLLTEGVDNSYMTKIDNGIVRNLANKAKELRSVYLQSDNINTPKI